MNKEHEQAIRQVCNIPDQFLIVQTSIKDIKPGDTICHKKQIKTVCQKDIKKCRFVGRSIFGDSYSCGHVPVLKLVYINPMHKGGIN